MSIKVIVGADGVPYTKTCGSVHAPGNNKITWELKTAGYEFLGLIGLPDPPFRCISVQPTEIVYENDNKGGTYPKDYDYQIIVRPVQRMEILTAGKAVIRNDPT